MKLERSINRLHEGVKLTIVALGDSLTHGWMVRKGFLDFIAEMLNNKYSHGNFTIINRGIPGDTAQGGLYRLKHDVIDMNPDLVFIQFGLNDAYTGISLESFKNTVRMMVDAIKAECGAEILLVTSVPLMQGQEDLIAEQFYRVLASISEEKDIPIAQVDRYWKKKISEGIDFRKLVQSDQFHPTVEGYRLMAEAIMEVL
jgi:lysophospholipase L1-like esterase